MSAMVTNAPTNRTEVWAGKKGVLSWTSNRIVLSPPQILSWRSRKWRGFPADFRIVELIVVESTVVTGRHSNESEICRRT
jgi:predicted small integral membrane protein